MVRQEFFYYVYDGGKRNPRGGVLILSVKFMFLDLCMRVQNILSMHSLLLVSIEICYAVRDSKLGSCLN